MISNRTGRPASRAIDPALVGVWERNGHSPVEIDAEGWLCMLGDPTSYMLDPVGQTLTITSAIPPAVYALTLGDGLSIYGVWTMRITDGADVWVEEFHYRDNGTYTAQLMRNGQFHSESIGTFIDDGMTIRWNDRRALVSTGAGSAIVLDQLYGPNEVGTYSVSTDGNQWVFEGPGKDVVYTRLVR